MDGKEWTFDRLDCTCIGIPHEFVTDEDNADLLVSDVFGTCWNKSIVRWMSLLTNLSMATA